MTSLSAFEERCLLESIAKDLNKWQGEKKRAGKTGSIDSSGRVRLQEEAMRWMAQHLMSLCWMIVLVLVGLVSGACGQG